MKQHRNVSNIRRSSSSSSLIPKIVEIRSHVEDTRSSTHPQRVETSAARSLMAKFSIRQTSVRGNGSRFARAYRENEARLEVDLKKEMEGTRVPKG